jgi:AcrR family transcriptional regulator
MLASDTKKHLLATAERLFAEYGIEAISARQIALAAGQRNQSAVHYHFGSKVSLIEALHVLRMAAINERRRAMLLEIENNAGRTGDLRAWIGAVAIPLAEWTAETPGGGYYVRFLAHLFADRHRRDVLIGRGEEAAVLRYIFRAIRALIPELPEPLWSERLSLIVGSMINALAARERMRAARDAGWRTLSDAAFLSNLLDIAVAVLVAPCSETTLSHIAAQETTPMEEWKWQSWMNERA